MEGYRSLVEEYNGRPGREYRLHQGKDSTEMSIANAQEQRKKSSENVSSTHFGPSFIWTLYLKPLLLDVFLPQGYPHTVTSDYMRYQIWDTTQAFASSLNGALATTAVLKGIGVGNESATVLAAAITWILRDGTGMLGRILFAWAKSSKLDSDCKQWRLTADLFNDIAFFVDLLAPYYSPLFFPMTCLSSLLRSLVATAGGATRTAVIRHQARRENLADVAAKDGSQETMVNVLSLIVSLVLLPQTDGRPKLVWALFLFFTAIHLYANYRAVTSLQLDTFNQQRFAIAVRHFIRNKQEILSIAECNRREPVLFTLTSIGRRNFGCSLRAILLATSANNSVVKVDDDSVIVAYDRATHTGWIALSTSATEDDCFNAAFKLEYYVETQRWPNIAEISKFRASALSAHWKLATHQMGFEEWRYRELK